MSSSTVPATLPHRAVANIRSPTGAGPTTPLRTIASNFGSPSSLRAEEDLIVVEIGTRKLQVGFAGDAAPRGCFWFGPEEQRRVGDFRAWQPDYHRDWKRAVSGRSWSSDHELWQYDIRGADLGLVGDKIERALREALTRYLLIDSRPRRMVCIVPSDLPIPLLSAALDSLFSRFLSPTISLLSSPVATAVAAGVRSALVVDLGWSETTVTGVYEYREVNCKRSIRAGRMLVEQMHKLLVKHLPDSVKGPKSDSPDASHEYALSFEECDDVATRLAWCKPHPSSGTAPTAEGLPTVQEQDESESRHPPASSNQSTTYIPLRSCTPPTSVQLSYESLSEPAENTFFESQYSPSCFDDHEQPLHLLVYNTLLQLPLDVRALCMSRIIFTGGCTGVLGLRGRIFDEVTHLVRERGWVPVTGQGPEQLRLNPKLKKPAPSQVSKAALADEGAGDEGDGVWHDAANSMPEVDPIEAQLKKGTDKKNQIQGELRAIESLGPWCGGSLITHFKTPAVAVVDRDVWLAQGPAGASRPVEVDPKTQRQSLGPQLLRGGLGAATWTLGIWGAT